MKISDNIKNNWSEFKTFIRSDKAKQILKVGAIALAALAILAGTIVLAVFFPKIVIPIIAAVVLGVILGIVKASLNIKRGSHGLYYYDR